MGLWAHTRGPRWACINTKFHSWGGTVVHHNDGIIANVLAASQIVIVCGYLSIPFLVLPYLPLSRTVTILAAGFFVGCAGTHSWMAISMTHNGGGWLVFWACWHVVQAFCTWGFILTFRGMLRAAQQHRRGGEVTL